MPEARDRLSRAEDVAAVYVRWRRAINESGNGGTRIRVRTDEPEEVRTTTPFRWGDMGMTAATSVASGGGLGRSRLERLRSGRQRHLLRSPGSLISVRGRGRGRGRGRAGSILPSWYPRTPLQDITSITRAIERRRASLREDQASRFESPSSIDQISNDQNLSTSDAELEHDISMVSPFATVGDRHPSAAFLGKSLKTPFPTVGNQHCAAVSVGKVPKILLDITNQNAGDSEFLTPQKKLLNSIDTVEKVVMEELQKLKRTPTARKAEREKKVRTLMSMR